MKKFFKEFKDFISRGNVLDMAVGIIVGGAFTAIITALVGNILTPLLNMIPGTSGAALQLVLQQPVTDEVTGAVIKEAVILDFGAVISAIVSLLVTALVLFFIIKAANSIKESGDKLANKMKKKAKKGEAEEAPAQEAVVEEVAPAPAPAPTTEELLTEIRDLLAKSSDGAGNAK